MFNAYALGGPEMALPALSFPAYGEMGFARKTGVSTVATGEKTNPF